MCLKLSSSAGGGVSNSNFANNELGVGDYIVAEGAGLEGELFGPLVILAFNLYELAINYFIEVLGVEEVNGNFSRATESSGAVDEGEVSIDVLIIESFVYVVVVSEENLLHTLGGNYSGEFAEYYFDGVVSSLRIIGLEVINFLLAIG